MRQAKTKPTVAEAAVPLRLEWRTPAELAENPHNWRRHPQAQLTALSAVLEEVGWAGVLLFNEVTNRLIDGHARREIALAQGVERVPVLVGSWTEEQEYTILATLDPIAAVAGADAEALDKLLNEVQTESAPISALLADLADAHALSQEGGGASSEEGILPARFQILLNFDCEADQTAALEKLIAEGYKCRSLIS